MNHIVTGVGKTNCNIEDMKEKSLFQTKLLISSL